jgi:hypothetical protein
MRCGEFVFTFNNGLLTGFRGEPGTAGGNDVAVGIGAEGCRFGGKGLSTTFNNGLVAGFNAGTKTGKALFPI